jgi:hypothetical protein
MELLPTIDNGAAPLCIPMAKLSSFDWSRDYPLYRAISADEEKGTGGIHLFSHVYRDGPEVRRYSLSELLVVESHSSVERGSH